MLLVDLKQLETNKQASVISQRFQLGLVDYILLSLFWAYLFSYSNPRDRAYVVYDS